MTCLFCRPMLHTHLPLHNNVNIYKGLFYSRMLYLSCCHYQLVSVSKGVIIVNFGYEGGRDLIGVAKPVVTFCNFVFCKLLLGFYRATKTFCRKPLKVRGTRT